MADSKISALTEKTVLTGAEEVTINDAGTSKKATVTNLNKNQVFVRSGDFDVNTTIVSHAVPTGASTVVSTSTGVYYIKANRNITIETFYTDLRFNNTSGTGRSRFSVEVDDVVEATSNLDYSFAQTGVKEVTGLNISITKGQRIAVGIDCDFATDGLLRISSITMGYSVD